MMIAGKNNVAWTVEKKRENRTATRLAKIDGAYTPVWEPADPKEDQPTSITQTDDVIEQIYNATEEDWKLIAFDDHDTLFRSTIMPEVIKTGWGPQRWLQRKTKYTPQAGFSVHALTCVFLSNKDITWFSRGNVDLEAVFRRGQFRNIRGTKTQMFRYIIYRATHEADFFAQYSATTKLQAILFFNEHRNRLRNLSLHGLEAICHYYQHNADDPVKRETALRQALTHIDVHNVPGFNAADIKAAMKMSISKRREQ